MLMDDGTVLLYRGRNTAAPGMMPEMVWDIPFFASYYGNKTVGVTRYWAAKEYSSRADLLIEVQRCAKIQADDRCKLNPNFDTAAAGLYKVLQVQHILDDDGQPVTDLTLERLVFDDEQG